MASHGRLETALLGCRLTISGPESALADARRELGAILDGDGLPTSADLTLDVDREATPADVLALITEAVVRNSPLHCVHAGSVVGASGAIAIPGHSGLGKTTLVAALVRRGFGLLSDEVLAVDRESGQIHPFARDLGLSSASMRVLGLAPAADFEGKRHVPARQFGSIGQPARLHDVILAERAPGPVTLERAERGDAVAELLRRSFNHYRAPAASLRSTVQVVGGARVWRARYENAPDLADAVVESVQPPVHSPASTAAK